MIEAVGWANISKDWSRDLEADFKSQPINQCKRRNATWELTGEHSTLRQGRETLHSGGSGWRLGMLPFSAADHPPGFIADDLFPNRIHWGRVWCWKRAAGLNGTENWDPQALATVQGDPRWTKHRGFRGLHCRRRRGGQAEGERG